MIDLLYLFHMTRLVVQLAESRVGPSRIRSVGVCAGSGASICDALGKSCDVFLTGEMSHVRLPWSCVDLIWL